LKKIIAQSDKSRDLVNVSILLMVALCIGIYLIATTAIIAKDGVGFIKYAQQIEADPVKTIVSEYQHPGYPWLILITRKVTALLYKDTSILTWIYCAQSVTLVFRLLAITVLYFIGKQLFGAKISFWATLVLILLPKPAEYGSDALSDWPHMFFLVLGILLLFNGASKNNYWLFGFVGLAAGVGYLIRPECAQLVVLGSLWLGLQLFWPRRSISKSKVLFSLTLLLITFLAVAGPYMKLKGAVFPKKDIGQFVRTSQQLEVHTKSNQTVSEATHTSQFTLTNIAKGFYKLVQNIGETLMWFFVPALFIGMHKRFKGRKWYEPERFFVIAIISLNVPVMLWLYCKYGYMSYRHTLPLLIIPILYVPVGLQELAIWFHKRFSKKAGSFAATNCDERFWFLVLFIIGTSICTPKLLRPIRIKKQGYRAAAQWLKANTDGRDIVVVSDKRISFYAEREGLAYENGNIPKKVEYIVKISKKGNDKTVSTKPFGEIKYEYVDKTKRGSNVIIYSDQ